MLSASTCFIGIKKKKIPLRKLWRLWVLRLDHQGECQTTQTDQEPRTGTIVVNKQQSTTLNSKSSLKLMLHHVLPWYPHSSFYNEHELPVWKGSPLLWSLTKPGKVRTGGLWIRLKVTSCLPLVDASAAVLTIPLAKSHKHISKLSRRR